MGPASRAGTALPGRRDLRRQRKGAAGPFARGGSCPTRRQVSVNASLRLFRKRLKMEHVPRRQIRKICVSGQRVVRQERVGAQRGCTAHEGSAGKLEETSTVHSFSGESGTPSIFHVLVSGAW